MAFLSGYTKRWSVTIDATKVPSTQTDFPVYVDLSDMPASFWNTVASGGGDIRVTQSNGTTEVAREVVSCDTGTDTGELHFLGNSVDGTTDTVFYIYANGTSADYAVGATYGRNAVWADYGGVWHLNEASGTRTDSTANGNDLTDNNTVTSAAGQIDDAAQFVRANSEYLSRADNASLSSGNIDFTIQQWVYLDNLTPTQKMACKWNSDPQNEWFTHYDTVVDKFSFGVSNDGTAFGGQVRSTTTPLISTWYHLHSQHDAAANFLRMYLNGTQEATEAYSAGVYDSTAQFEIGRIQQLGGLDYLDGRVDEVRFRKSLLSANWITTEYNNQSSPSTFYTVGAEETDGGGGGAAGNPLFAFGGM